ncbi:hypothetical protein EMG21_32095, partial [Klebsiella pneumoniae]
MFLLAAGKKQVRTQGRIGLFILHRVKGGRTRMIGLPKIPSKKDVFVVKRAQEKESGHPFVAKLKFEDRNLRFEMCLTAEEADIYQNAQSTYEKIKESHPDPAEVKHWKEQKFISLHEHFGEKIRRYSSMA